MLARIAAFSLLLLLFNSAVHAQHLFSSSTALAGFQPRSNAQGFDGRNLVTNQNTPSAKSACSLCRGLLGIGLGLGIHEAGHLVANVAFRSDPYIKGVRGGGLPLDDFLRAL